MPEKLTMTKSTLYLPDTAKEEVKEEEEKYGVIEGSLCLMPICRPDKALAPHPGYGDEADGDAYRVLSCLLGARFTPGETMTTDQHQEILRTEGLSKFFPGVKALDNVDFSLRRGEIMALLGENGAGKSTLIKALTGVYHADRGTIWPEGQAISPKNTAHAQQLGIGTVYQEVNLLPNMSVADNLFIGREPKRFGLLRRKEMEKRATELMASYGFSLDVREPLNRFSVAMQQIVAICRAIDLSAKVLILDEPTASLDTQEVELLFGLMRQLRDRGVSLIFVTHFLDQVYQVSDRITVLRNGSFVGCRERASYRRLNW